MDLLSPLRLAERFALPPRCAGCGAIVEEAHRFCAGCWTGLRFLGPPWCAGCNLPFPYHLGEDARCAACLAGPPRHAGVRAAVAYDDVSRGLALRLKYGRRIGLAETMARPMARVLPETIELLVPVPLHRGRLWSRGFNQAVLLADAIGKKAALPVERAGLTRTRATPSMRGRTPGERAKAVRGAFAVPERARLRVAGRALGLVDDVYTTGATADAAVRALLRAGAASVTVICWARVIPDDD